MTYAFIPSPHFSRRTKPISAIVLHYTASLSTEDTLRWFQRQDSKQSAHYLIGRDGTVVQMVRDDATAWHAGKSQMPGTSAPAESNVNVFSLGVELVGCADSGFTDRQMASCYQLLEQLVARYHIPPERVVGHAACAPGRRLDPDGFEKQYNWRKTYEVCAAAYHATRLPHG
jgi:N-acetylmuramoyl-L-alanine amidase